MKGYRTLLINLGLAIAPVLEATHAVDLGLDGTAAQVYGLVVAVINIGLRAVTTTPIGKK